MADWTTRALFTFGALLFESSLWAQNQPVEFQSVMTANMQLRAAMRAGVRRSGVSAIARDRVDLVMLRRRADLLQQLIKTKPDLARDALLRPEEIASLNTTLGLPPDLVEHVQSHRGPVTVKVVDSADWKSSLYQFEISDETGTYSGYYTPSPESPRIGCGDSVQLHGYRIGNVMLVTRLAVVSAAADPLCSSVGDQQVAVILVSFPSNPGGSIAPSDYQQVFFGNGRTVSSFYSEGSYGRDALHGDVFGYYTLDRDYNSCDDSQAIATAAKIAAQKDVTFSKYQRVVVIAPPPGGCGFGGWGSVGCNDEMLPDQGKVHYSTSYLFQPSKIQDLLGAAAHEMGHNHGLGHARSLFFSADSLGPDRGRASYQEYGDPYSTMGGGSSKHFAAPHKSILGWLTHGSDWVEVSENTTVDLVPISSPMDGFKAIRIRRGSFSNEWIWAEYRTDNGFDNLSASSLKSGVLLHDEIAQDLSTYLFTTGGSFQQSPLALGEIWRDKYTNLTLQVLKADSGSTRLSVWYETPCATANWRQNSLVGNQASAFFADVVADSNCKWSYFPNNGWLSAAASSGSGSSNVEFDVAENLGASSRNGSVSIERQTDFIQQQPVYFPSSLRFLTPATASLSTSSYIGYVLGIDAPNSTGSVDSFDVVIGATPNFAASCALHYSLGLMQSSLFDDSGALNDPSVRTNTQCTVTHVSDSRPEDTYGEFSFSVLPKPGLLGASHVWVRFNDMRVAAAGQWQQVADVVPAGNCPAFLSYGYARVSGPGWQVNADVNIPANCNWNAKTDQDWVTISPQSGTGRTTVHITPQANGSLDLRTATIYFNEAPFVLQQLPKDLYGFPYARFMQNELDISRVGISGTLQFDSNLPADALHFASDAAWFRITKVVTGVAGGPLLYYECDTNVGTSTRRANVTVLGSSLLVVQESGSRSGDYSIAGFAGADGTAEGKSATSAILHGPRAAAVGPNGDIYFTEVDASRVRKVALDGTLSTIAGTGIVGFNGDGKAVSSSLNHPQGIAVDKAGNVYIADTDNQRIRRISTDGMISTIAGGRWGFGGDGGMALQASFEWPSGLAVGADGSVYIADTWNHRIRRIDAKGMMSTYAGTGTAGYTGDGGAAVDARINEPRGVALDSAGNLYIAESSSSVVRMVSKTGQISTLAGTGAGGFNGEQGQAKKIQLSAPHAVAADSQGNVYVGEYWNQRVRKVSPDGTLVTIAGGGPKQDPTSGTATQAALGFIEGIAVNASGDVVFTDQLNQRVLRISNQKITRFAGADVLSPLGDGGQASDAFLNSPSALAADSKGNLYLADSDNHRIRKIGPNGQLTTIVGTGVYGSSVDGVSALSAQIGRVAGLAFNAGGVLTFTDPDGAAIRALGADSRVTKVAGVWWGFSGDGGQATKAYLSGPTGIAFDSKGNMYFADQYNNRIRRIDPSGVITTVAGNGTGALAGDGGPAVSGSLWSPAGVAIDSADNLYIADTANNRIRKISASGVITTFAGTSYGYSGDGRSALAAQLAQPQGVAVDGKGNVWVADTINNSVRRIDPSGIISTVAGNGQAGYTGDGGPAWAAQLYNPTAVLPLSDGSVIVADRNNHRLRKLIPDSSTTGTPSVSTPTIRTGGVVNAASLLGTIAPGGWFSIFGSNLASNTRQWNASDFVNSRLPTLIDGVEVLVGGKPAYVYFISPGQINALAPADLDVGTVSVQATNSQGTSNSIAVTVGAVSPEFFRFGQGSGQFVAAVLLDGTYVAPATLFGSLLNSRPAHPGETIQLFASGLGPTSPAWVDGMLPSEAYPLSGSAVVTIGSQSAKVDFAGLIGPGLYQLNVVVPAVPDGNSQVKVTVQGSTSQAIALLPVMR